MDCIDSLRVDVAPKDMEMINVTKYSCVNTKIKIKVDGGGKKIIRLL